MIDHAITALCVAILGSIVAISIAIAWMAFSFALKVAA